jgi:NADP-dependent 3-hydroxy acid dehydrogenase YdfG
MNSGPVVIVTGASTGFGRLIAETLARKHYRVFATMRDLAGRNASAAGAIWELAQRENLSLEPLEIDVTDEASVDRGVDAVVKEVGRVDVLVNNAGNTIVDLAETVTSAQAEELFDTNVFGVLRMNRAVLPAMKRQGSGLLLHVSSGAGRTVIPGMGLYCATKYAVEAIVETYRYELASLGIDSVAIEPGAYPTAIMTKLPGGDDPGRAAGYGDAAQIPDKVRSVLTSSKANAQDIADAVFRIIDTPAGTRQLRYRVGGRDTATERINALTDELQVGILKAFGMTELARFKKG